MSPQSTYDKLATIPISSSASKCAVGWPAVVEVSWTEDPESFVSNAIQAYILTNWNAPSRALFNLARFSAPATS